MTSIHLYNSVKTSQWSQSGRGRRICTMRCKSLGAYACLQAGVSIVRPMGRAGSVTRARNMPALFCNGQCPHQQCYVYTLLRRLRRSQGRLMGCIRHVLEG
ncbi:uncharacterized protein PV07_04474 [Cladophialophora immunda]|uniref:Uncharacterized protein n=1 Tax=Cladophialophora immunda TaxID=569365 RepID=A0A0D2B5Y0_9EURO|nr:uncharacterized protein PV07_04474 [Cladophialophora immunda]KIW32967.1 hypothetical protein PV07_04474 [Cladophialophora immunda]